MTETAAPEPIDEDDLSDDERWAVIEYLKKL